MDRRSLPPGRAGRPARRRRTASRSERPRLGGDVRGRPLRARTHAGSRRTRPHACVRLGLRNRWAGLTVSRRQATRGDRAPAGGERVGDSRREDASGDAAASAGAAGRTAPGGAPVRKRMGRHSRRLRGRRRRLTARSPPLSPDRRSGDCHLERQRLSVEPEPGSRVSERGRAGGAAGARRSPNGSGDKDRVVASQPSARARLHGQAARRSRVPSGREVPARAGRARQGGCSPIRSSRCSGGDRWRPLAPGRTTGVPPGRRRLGPRARSLVADPGTGSGGRAVPARA